MKGKDKGYYIFKLKGTIPVSRILDRLKDFMGFSEDDSGDYDYQEEEVTKKEHTSTSTPEPEPEPEPEPKPERPARRRYRAEQPNININPMENNPRNNNNVIGMPGVNTASSEVVVFEPHSYAEIPKVIQTLRQRRSVVLNLNTMDPEDAQRAVDFVAGGTYALDGHQERIGECIFLFTPSCVKVSSLIGSGKEESDTPNLSSVTATKNTWTSDSRIAR